MPVLDVIKTRRSIRKYLPTPVEEEKLAMVLEAGRLSPAANNAQMWKFVVVRDPELIKKMVFACGGQSFVGEAPVVIAVCTDGEARDMYCGQPARTVDCSIATAYMILTATDLGLGTCWLGHFNNEKVKRLLNVPDDNNVVAVFPLGYADGTAAPRPRRAIDEIVAFDKWQEEE